MSKKTIGKILDIVRSLRAPLKLLPYIIAVVIGFISRRTQDDRAELVCIEEQGFISRLSSEIMGGCHSPCAAKTADGLVAAFVCTRLVDNTLVNSICLVKCSDSSLPGFSRRQYILSTPMNIDRVTLTDTPNGLMVSWYQTDKRTDFAPSNFSESERLSFEKSRLAAVALLPEAQRETGTYYAFVPTECNPVEQIFKAPDGVSSCAVALSENELMWLGVCDGKATAYLSTNGGKSFSAVGTVPDIQDGRAVREACCVKLAGGRLFAVINGADEFFSSYSDDMGRRWSVVQKTDIKGTSPSLSVRSDGVAALTYAVHERKAAVRSRISRDGQYDWCDERVSAAGIGTFRGNPYTVAVDNSFYTVSTQCCGGDKEASVLFTLWKPHKDDFDDNAKQTETERKK